MPELTSYGTVGSVLDQNQMLMPAAVLCMTYQPPPTLLNEEPYEVEFVPVN